MQGGIPQCAEMLARYVAGLLTKKFELPSNFRDLALAEGKCEEEGFHESKNVLVLVDYAPFMLSLSRLMGCEPAIPLTVHGMVKYWTFPLWTCFFRTKGLGAKPQVCEAVLDRFGTFDAVTPMPLVLIQIVLTFLTPFLNFASFLYASIFERRGRGVTTGSGLPAAYKFRMSKIHNMSGNDLRLTDFGMPVLVSWIAALAMIINMIWGLFFGKVDAPEPEVKLTNSEDAANLLLTSFRHHSESSHPQVLEQESIIFMHFEACYTSQLVAVIR